MKSILLYYEVCFVKYINGRRALDRHNDFQNTLCSGYGAGVFI